MKLIKHAAIKIKAFLVCLGVFLVSGVFFLFFCSFVFVCFFSFSVLQQICKQICRLLLCLTAALA